jgi:hypothetical protein
MCDYLVQCEFFVGPYNNYLLAGNLCNAFAVGEVGAMDDFFLIASEPDDESNYPLLTGNILDSEGNVLLRLVRNVLVVNPGACSKIVADLCSYEIRDSAGTPVLSVRTVFECPPGKSEKMYVTTIKGTFYNKNQEVVLRANSGEGGDELVIGNTKCVFGARGGSVGLVMGYAAGEELEFVKLVLATHGRIQRPLLGRIEKQEITLDGAALMETEVVDCTVHVSSGNFMGRNPLFKNCKFIFHGEAENIRQLVVGLLEDQRRGEKRG